MKALDGDMVMNGCVDNKIENAYDYTFCKQ
jgi:hypothetical protein